MQTSSQEKRITVSVDFEGHQEQLLDFGEDSETDILLDYQKMRKAIVAKYKYTATSYDKIRLILLNFYPQVAPIPIMVAKNYVYLIKIMLVRGTDHLSFRVCQTGELMRRRTRGERAPVEFDSDGSIESVENDQVKQGILMNRPRQKPYKEQDAVRCEFCHVSSRESSSRRQCGPFYGPFVGKKYAHLLCLLWCSHVFLNDKLRLQKVKEGIEASKGTSCSYCGQRGASFLCHNKRCPFAEAGHYACAFKNKWYFNWHNYTTFCPACSPTPEPQEMEVEAIKEEKMEVVEQ